MKKRDRNKRKSKEIIKKEFEPIMDKDWEPVKLDKKSLSKWMQKIPPSERCLVYASGCSLVKPNDVYNGSEIGGFDVYRDARSHLEPFCWNKGKYLIIQRDKDF